MMQRLTDRSWIVLLILAVGLVVACSSSSGSGSGDEDSGKTAADAMTKG
jgi:hypothetical protein